MGLATYQTNNSAVNSEDTEATSSATISPILEWLKTHPVRLYDDELNDERTQYILSKWKRYFLIQTYY